MKVCKTSTATKCSRLYFVYGVGDSERSYKVAFIKHTVCNFCHTFRKNQLSIKSRSSKSIHAY